MGVLLRERDVLFTVSEELEQVSSGGPASGSKGLGIQDLGCRFEAFEAQAQDLGLQFYLLHGAYEDFI